MVNVSVFGLEPIDGREAQPHNNKYIPLIVFWHHFSLSLSFCSPLSFLLPSSCPHYLSLVYSITFPQFLCLPASSYWFSFIGFHPFHSHFSALTAPCSLPLTLPLLLTTSQVNAVHILSPFFCYNIRYFWTLQGWEARLRQRACTAGEEISIALRYSTVIKVTLLPYSMPGNSSWYGSRKLSVKRGCTSWYQKTYHRVQSLLYNWICFMDVDVTHIKCWLSREVRWLNSYMVRSHCIHIM